MHKAGRLNAVLPADSRGPYKEHKPRPGGSISRSPRQWRSIRIVAREPRSTDDFPLGVLGTRDGALDSWTRPDEGQARE
jgi:hypothetical protein